MSDSQGNDHVWALVLAGGDGNRLRSLTTTADGTAVPKQYCSLHGDQTLLDNALTRAEAVVAKENVLTIVAAHHRQWWQGPLNKYDDNQVIVQPKNCGTAIGIMLPLLHILKRDPRAKIVMLPSDHHVREESILTDVLSQAVSRINQEEHDKMIVLGMEPDEADSELGYIVPDQHLGYGISSVSSFVEKPPLLRAHQLISQGALWNTFIVAAKAEVLLKLFAQRCAGILEDMREVISNNQYDNRLQSLLLNELYSRLPSLDFSKDILQGLESTLELLSVPFCGWTDLGTPRRVRDVLLRWPHNAKPRVGTSPISVTLAANANFIMSKQQQSPLPRLATGHSLRE